MQPLTVSQTLHNRREKKEEKKKHRISGNELFPPSPKKRKEKERKLNEIPRLALHKRAAANKIIVIQSSLCVRVCC